MDPHPRPDEGFEETYPRHAFAELVRLAVALGLRFAAWRFSRLASRELRKRHKAKQATRRGLSPVGRPH